MNALVPTLARIARRGPLAARPPAAALLLIIVAFTPSEVICG